MVNYLNTIQNLYLITMLFLVVCNYLNIVIFSLLNKEFINTYIHKPLHKYILPIKILHNVISISMSTYLFLGILNSVQKYKFTYVGNYYDETHKDLSYMLNMFYLSKYYELFDTMLMIIQMNYNQISFLHVYHHMSIILVWYFIVNVEPGGDAYLSALINSFIHIVMYSYYLITSFVKDNTLRKKYLWWGKYLTQFQITQFGINFIHAIYCIYLGNYSKLILMIQIVYMSTFIGLFSNFYIKKYIKS